MKEIPRPARPGFPAPEEFGDLVVFMGDAVPDTSFEARERIVIII
jgi:hypothetical protein